MQRPYVFHLHRPDQRKDRNTAPDGPLAIYPFTNSHAENLNATYDIPVIPINHDGPGLVTQALRHSIDYGIGFSLHEIKSPAGFPAGLFRSKLLN